MAHVFFCCFLFVCLFLAARRLSLVTASWGFSLVAALRLLTAVTSLAAEHRF